MREVEVVDKIVQRLPALLPNLDVRKIRREWRTPGGGLADIVAEARSGGKWKLLIFEAKSNGEPRMALAVVTQLRRLVSGVGDAYPVFCAPFVPASSRTLLKEEGVGYLDLAGNAYLRYGEVLVDRSAPDPPPRRRLGTRELLAPKATRILRALLNIPGKAFGVREIAALCRLSPAAVISATRLLEDKAFIERDAQ